MNQKDKERFWSKVKFTTDCWIWIGSKNNSGYGCFSYNKTCVGAHRFSYELYHGKIPEKMTLDHLCRVRYCVNPEHVEVVTCRENLLRGKTIPSKNSQKTHCVNGHELKDDNLYSPNDGSRQCKTCRYSRNKKRDKNKLLETSKKYYNKNRIMILQKKKQYLIDKKRDKNKRLDKYNIHISDILE